jgi:opacity protein-like surface antigen
MIGSRHLRLARALSASVAAGALMLAATGGANAQSPSPEKPQASAKAAKKKTAPALATPAAAGPYAMATKGPAPLVTPAWTGLYAGVSFGPGLFRANTSTVFHSVETQNVTFSTGTQTTTRTQDTVGSASGSNWGAHSDIYLGWNFRPGGNVIAGVQVEGTIANERALLDGVSTSVTNRTTVTTPPGSTSSSSTVTTSNLRDSLGERWAASALGRLGVLVAPRDLAYVIGGYTRGGFEWNGRSFGLNGATAGAGWEHEIAPSWTLKAEYRFTAFEAKDLPPRGNNSTSTQVDVFAGGSATTTDNFASTALDRASGIALHALHLGITHYFDAAPGAAPVPYGMFTKAPPVVATPWEGPYAGVSYGPALITAKTSNVENSTSVRTINAGTPATTLTNTVTNASGNNIGALSDVFFGWNYRLRGNVIAGVQVEGIVADVDTALNATQVQLTTAPTFTDLFTVNFVEHLAERWAVSALGRVGVLLDPQDLVYGIGGYTRGGFEWSNRTFGLNGATVGAGWEHEIAPSWTLKAEYRYTAFADKDLPRTAFSASTQRSVSTTGAVTTTVTNTTAAITDRVSDVNLHALRFGITHYFSDVPLAPAPSMAVKAPPLAGPVWTGVYGGVSFGLMSMRAKAETVSNEVFALTETFPGTLFTDVETLSTVSNTSGRHAGAVADLLIGYNALLGPKLIGGVQFEGSLAHGAVLGNGSFVQNFTDTSVQTPPGGAAGTDVTTGTSSGNIRLDVQSRWMASALGRLGVLVDPRDLVYAIGGWSFGGFTTGDFTTGMHPFNLNGPTVGVGIEREVAPAWTLRAEYRYTHFLPRDVTAPQTQVEAQTAGTTTFLASDSFAETDRISVDMHTVRFGIAHYFATR